MDSFNFFLPACENIEHDRLFWTYYWKSQVVESSGILSFWKNGGNGRQLIEFLGSFS